MHTPSSPYSFIPYVRSLTYTDIFAELELVDT